jgi:hypothetical protein
MHAPESWQGLAPGWRFQAMGHHARPLRADEVPLLQALYEANPLYFETVTGRGPRPHEAQEAFDDRPPRTCLTAARNAWACSATTARWWA